MLCCAFQDVSRPILPGVRGPLRRVAAELPPGYRSFFEKVVLHLKIVFTHDAEPEAKAYLSFEHFWQGFLHVLRGRGKWGVIG